MQNDRHLKNLDIKRQMYESYSCRTQHYPLVSYFQVLSTKGAFFWDYSVDSYSGIRIREHTEKEPKRTDSVYSENRIADMTKNKVMRPRKSRYAIYTPPEDRRKLAN